MLYLQKDREANARRYLQTLEENKMSITLTATPSLNVLKDRWALSKWKKKYIAELSGYVHIYGKAQGKRTVIVRRYGSRILDVDNFTGGLKSMIDSLKYHKLIIDDRAEFMELQASQEKTVRGKSYTVIEIL